MRITEPVRAFGRKHLLRPRDDQIPFQMLLPLALKKEVSGKGDKMRDPVCMQELQVLFACFKKNEFDQSQCSKEIGSFQSCFKDYFAKAASQRKMGKEGILVPGETKMTHRQINTLLKKFPPKN